MIHGILAAAGLYSLAQKCWSVMTKIWPRPQTPSEHVLLVEQTIRHTQRLFVSCCRLLAAVLSSVGRTKEADSVLDIQLELSLVMEI